MSKKTSSQQQQLWLDQQWQISFESHKRVPGYKFCCWGRRFGNKNAFSSLQCNFVLTFGLCVKKPRKTLSIKCLESFEKICHSKINLDLPSATFNNNMISSWQAKYFIDLSPGSVGTLFWVLWEVFCSNFLPLTVCFQLVKPWKCENTLTALEKVTKNRDPNQ